MKEVRKTSFQGSQGSSSLDRLTQSTASSRNRGRSTSRERPKPDDTGVISQETSKIDSRLSRPTLRSSYPPASRSNRTLRSHSRESTGTINNQETGEVSNIGNTGSSQPFETTSECDETTLPDVTGGDHVNKSVGPKEQLTTQ